MEIEIQTKMNILEDLKGLEYIGIEGELNTGMVYLINSNLKNMIKQILFDINEFTNSNKIKLQALKQLLHTLVIAQGKVKPYLEEILRTVYKNLFLFDEKEFVQIMKEICNVLGVVVETEILIPLVIGHLNSELQKTAFKTIENIIVREYNNIAYLGLEFLKTLLEKMGNEPILKLKSSEIFSPYLAIQSTVTRVKGSKELTECTELLSKSCGYNSVGDMYSNEVKEILEKLYLEKDYSSWDKYSKDRFKFDVIVRFCKEGISKYIEIVIDVISKCSDSSKDPVLRFDMLALMDFIAGCEEVRECLRDNAEEILKKVFNKVLVWRTGEPNIKIRKSGVVCLTKMLKNDLIPAEDFYTNYDDIVGYLKNCLDDDWAPDLRYTSTKLMQYILDLVKDQISEFQISTLRPLLLERLDDAQDPVRIEVCNTLKYLFKCKNALISDGTLRYVVKTCFIHLDDRNEEVQMAVFNFLKFASSSKLELVHEEAVASLPKQKFPRLCEELIKYLEQKKEESGENEVITEN